MPPIKVALIGLSANAATSWAAKAHLPYLLSVEGRAKYTIVALCNTTTTAAERAIAHFGLDPATTKAYGDPAALAADPDIELVVVSTRVDQHYSTVLPSLAVRKDAFVEWPLAENSQRAAELARVAAEKGSRTVVGLQAWFAPSIVALRELFAGGRRIGKVLSSEVRAAGGTLDRATLSPFLEYFADRDIGGNAFTIGLGHLFDYVQFVLGDVHDMQSRLQLQRPDVKIKDPASGAILGALKSNVPDLIHMTGTLPESDYVTNDATLHIRYRRGQPFKGEPPMVWAINGENGEIRFIARGGPTVNVTSKENAPVIEVHDFTTDEVEQINYNHGPRLDIELPARNVGSVYEAFAARGEIKYAGFDHAVKRHLQLDRMLLNYDESRF
ncbi:oxidoreductase family protein [Apiospora saccharicola]|uniref:Oxidoreductase family protein n=1 Tax=Apiospora saccharicola TaxID=335842 RepID=A0ABR1UPI3_9PEZI